MRKILMAGIAVLALGVASPVLAQSDASAGAAVGGAAGAATGGTIGFFLGGPVGAVIGGFTGAVIGGSAGVSASTIDYAARNPVDPIYIDDSIDVGYRVNGDIQVYPIEGDDQYGYFYANNRVYIVDMASGEVVQSPGYVIPSDTVAYIQAHPIDDVDFSGDLAPGAHVEASFQMGTIPDNPDYSYIYVQGRPVLVDNRTNLVVWIG